MARSRNIKPGFFDNPDLAKLPMAARLLFIGLWCQCDRDGRIEDKPERIRARVFPFEKVPVHKYLEMLADGGAQSFIIRYTVNGVGFVQIRAWKKHQNPHLKEQPSTIQAPDMHGAGTGQALLFPAQAPTLPGLIPDSSFLIPDSSNPVSGADFVWKEAGFESPEDGETWWQVLVFKHANRKSHGSARAKFLDLVLTGCFTRKQFEDWYAGQLVVWASWPLPPNLQQLFTDCEWRMPPPPIDELSNLSPTMRAVLAMED